MGKSKSIVRLAILALSLSIVSLLAGCQKRSGPFRPPHPLLHTIWRTFGPSHTMDVHGAGAQRSDPKTGRVEDYPSGGHGPQGDIQRVYNYARCVRGISSPTASYSIVSTGQASCYDDGKLGEIPCPREGEPFAGQDGYYSKLSKPDLSYQIIEHADGDVVLDKNTGLMWTRSFDRSLWQNRNYAAKRRKDGGYTDWRVPTIKELYSLIRFNGRTGDAPPWSTITPRDAIPYIDNQSFHFEYPTYPSRFIDAQYISSTDYGGKVMEHDLCFFGLNLADGRIKCYPQSGNLSNPAYYIRFVRNTQKTGYGENHFIEGRNGTIQDTATGLTWMKMDSGDIQFSHQLEKTKKKDGSLDFPEALQFCEDLTFAGKTDWRLPDAKELQSIVDYSRSPDATDSASLDPVFKISPIVNEAGDGDFPAFWSSTTHLDGPRPGKRAIYILFGRGMGSM